MALGVIAKNGVLFEDYAWHSGGQVATKEDENGVVTNYTWDGEKLIEVADSDGLRIEYAYDENDDLIRRTAFRAGALISDERYLVDRQNLTGYSQIVAEIDGITGQVIKYNTFADEIKSQSPANGTVSYYLHTDALGSVRSLTSEGVQEQYDYAAFGARLPGSGSLTDYAFTGQWRDPLSGLQYHRARWLNTVNGLWLSEDAVFDFPFNLGNLYAYVGHNPVGRTDISGAITNIEIAVVAAIAAIVVLAGVDAYLVTGDPWEGLKASGTALLYVVGLVLAFAVLTAISAALAFVVVALFLAVGVATMLYTIEEAYNNEDWDVLTVRILTLALVLFLVGYGMPKLGKMAVQELKTGMQTRVPAGQAAKTQTSEVAGSIHNLGSQTLARNATVLEEYSPGSPFSAVYDPILRIIMLRPSVDMGRAASSARYINGEIPQEPIAVPRAGGHRIINQDYITATEGKGHSNQTVGFTARLIRPRANRGKGSLRIISWRSRSVNQRNYGDIEAARRYAHDIKQTLEETTGYNVEIAPETTQ